MKTQATLQSSIDSIDQDSMFPQIFVTSSASLFGFLLLLIVLA